MSKLSEELFGEVKGQKVTRYIIEFKGKLKASVINYGCILTSLEVPNRRGNMGDIVLGFDNLEQYLHNPPYFGAVIGRYGGRIAGGEFSIDGNRYEVVKNNGENHLHGGMVGFNKVVWESEAIDHEDSIVIKFKYNSPDGEENYPGALSTLVTYTFTGDEFRIAYQTTTDKPTIINLTQHTYFNLSDSDENVLGHELQLFSDKFVPVDAALIPTGILEDVAGTPFDFRTAKTIGKDIRSQNLQIDIGNGYDHCFVLDNQNFDKPQLAGSAYHKKSGRFMELFTTEPGVQLYTANYLDGGIVGKDGKAYKQNDGFCLETQHFPDSPNQLNFPSPILRPGTTFNSSTIYRFGVR
jgi:aldose 1-epimerase